MSFKKNLLKIAICKNHKIVAMLIIAPFAFDINEKMANIPARKENKFLLFWLILCSFVPVKPAAIKHKIEPREKKVQRTSSDRLECDKISIFRSAPIGVLTSITQSATAKPPKKLLSSTFLTIR